jgi:hypothetical protein
MRAFEDGWGERRKNRHTTMFTPSWFAPATAPATIAEVTQGVAKLGVVDAAADLVVDADLVIIESVKPPPPLPETERIPAYSEYREVFVSDKRQRMVDHVAVEDRKRYLRIHIARVVKENMALRSVRFGFSAESDGLSPDDKDYLPYMVGLLTGYCNHSGVISSGWFIDCKVAHP